MKSMHLARNSLPCAVLAAVICCGCGNVADKDPWIRLQRCTVENRSSSDIMKVFLRCLEPAWETAPIKLLQPGESQEIALPSNGIPEGYVTMHWMTSDTAHEFRTMHLSKSKSKMSALHFVITDGDVLLE